MGNNWLDHQAQRVVVNGSHLACSLGGFHVCGERVGINIWVTAVGHMEPFRPQLHKTVRALLGIWCWPAFKYEDETEPIHSKWVCDLSVQGGSISVVSQQWWSKNGWNWCRTSVGLLWIFVWQAAYSCSIEVISNRKPWRGQCHCLPICIPSAWELIAFASSKWRSGFQKGERWNVSSTCDVIQGCGWMCSIAEASSWIIISWMIR